MFPKMNHKTKIVWYALVCAVVLFPLFAAAEPPRGLSSGEILYVPIYSNVYSGPKGNPFQLATMLSIHNVDPKYSFTLLKVDYYDSSGKFIESYIKKPMVLKPFAHTFFYLKEYDTRGGPGANFVVKWKAEKNINQPIVEALMLDTRAGVSFSSSGQVITEHAK